MIIGNGKGDVTVEQLDMRSMLEILLEAVQQLTEQVEDLKEVQAELIEKVSNMSTPGSDFGTDDLDLDFE